MAGKSLFIDMVENTPFHTSLSESIQHVFKIFIYFHFVYFLIGKQLLYNIVLVSAIQKHESTTGIHMSLLS